MYYAGVESVKVDLWKSTTLLTKNKVEFAAMIPVSKCDIMPVVIFPHVDVYRIPRPVDEFGSLEDPTSSITGKNELLILSIKRIDIWSKSF